MRTIAVTLGLLAILVANCTLAVAADSGCRKERFKEVPYTVCSFDLRSDDVRVFWRDREGTPYRTFSSLADQLEAENRTLAFATNGGMYTDDLSPVGLLVIEGIEHKAANTVDIKKGVVPNFHKKPNGVFFIADNEAGVLETMRFLKEKPEADFATQSGPMLVIDNRIHPAFIAGSPYVNRRNGVCASTPTEVHFAITDGVVNFDNFARFFRDQLGCRNALFLDGGSATGIYAPDHRRNDPPGHGGYGPIIAVVKENR